MAYVMNRMGEGTLGDVRGASLVGTGLRLPRGTVGLAAGCGQPPAAESLAGSLPALTLEEEEDAGADESRAGYAKDEPTGCGCHGLSEPADHRSHL